jgi:hypothetical protein
LLSQSRGINGVAGNCGDTGMEQKLLAGIWRARTGETLSSSDWRRQKLSARADFSRHCLRFILLCINKHCKTEVVVLKMLSVL